MTRGAGTCILALLALVGSLFALVESAAAQTVQANPPSVNVPATRSASVPVTWELTNDVISGGPILSVNSQSAQLFFAGPNGSGNLELPRPLVHGPIEPGQTARIRETMIIPQSFLTRVLQAGTRTIAVERFFEVEVAPGQFVTAEGQLDINITGSLGAGLQINRIDLRFQNEAVQIIVPQRHPPEVRADISYTGTGLFRAVWEVADSRVTAAGGPTIFRILRQDRIRLGAGGFKRVKGPRLPAELTGLHVVRFRVLDGPLAGEAPVVRYFVKRASPDGEDWWKRYIRPHEEGEGLVRVPAEPEDEEPFEQDVVEPAPEPEDEAPADDGIPAEDDGAPDSAEDSTDEEGGEGDVEAQPVEENGTGEENGEGDVEAEPDEDDGADEEDGEGNVEAEPDEEEDGDEDAGEPEE